MPSSTALVGSGTGSSRRSREPVTHRCSPGPVGYAVSWPLPRLEFETRNERPHRPIICAAVLKPAKERHEGAQYPSAVLGLGQVAMAGQVAPWAEDPQAQVAEVALVKSQVLEQVIDRTCLRRPGLDQEPVLRVDDPAVARHELEGALQPLVQRWLSVDTLAAAQVLQRRN
jgi:hypothetical protein